MTAAQFPDDMTLEDARAVLRTPVCQQRAAIYPRTLNSVAVRAIIALYRTHGRSYGHVQDVAREHLADVAGQGGQLLLGQHWGLIEEELRVRPDGGRAGYWRVTELGEQFIHGRHAVQSHARLYAGRFLRHTGREITVQDALGTGFDLADLIGPQPVSADLGEQDALFAVPDQASPYRADVAA